MKLLQRKTRSIMGSIGLALNFIGGGLVILGELTGSLCIIIGCILIGIPMYQIWKTPLSELERQRKEEK